MPISQLMPPQLRPFLGALKTDRKVIALGSFLVGGVVVSLWPWLAGAIASLLFLVAVGRRVMQFQSESRRERSRRSAIAAGLHTEALSKLYDGLAASCDLTHYTPVVDGQPFATGVLGRANELELCLRIPGTASDTIHFGRYDLVDAPPDTPASIDGGVAEYLEGLAARGTRIADLPVYRLLAYEIAKDTWNWRFCLGTYGRWHYAMGRLNTELFDALLDTGLDVPSLVRRRTDLLPPKPTTLRCGRPKPARQTVLLRWCGHHLRVR